MPFIMVAIDSHMRLHIGVNSNFCSSTHRLATMVYIRYRQTTDRRTDGLNTLS